MKKIITLIICLVALIADIAYLNFYTPSSEGFAPEIVAHITAEPLSEVSGMVKSRSYENTFWVVNDSGAEARIFAINREGINILPTYSRFSYFGEVEEEGKHQWPGFNVLYTRNVDWESMTADDNFIYVADTGNNLNNRKDLGIYMLSEIDPTASTQSAAIKYLPVRYPEQTEFPGIDVRHFDSEALFNADNSLYLITKHRSLTGAFEPGANLYRIDTDYTDEDNDLTLIDSHPEMMAVTGAELSPDTQTLAVITYDALWLFDRPEQGDAWLSSSYRRLALDTEVVQQMETVVWDDDMTLILTNEQRDLFRVNLADHPEQPQ